VINGSKNVKNVLMGESNWRMRGASVQMRSNEKRKSGVLG